MGTISVYVWVTRKHESDRTQDPTTMATPLVPLHVAPNTKCFPTAGAWTFERFLPRVRVAVDPEAGRPREGLVARLADVSILGLRERC